MTEFCCPIVSSCAGPLSPILSGDVSSLLEKFTLATFRDRLGSRFRVSPDGSQPVTIELIEMTDLTSGGGPEALKRDAETIAGESTPVSFGEQRTGGHQRGRDAAARWWITRTSG